MTSHPRTARFAAPAIGITLTGALLAGCASSANGDPEEDGADEQNLLTAAAAWRVTAAERDMLYEQGFNTAKDRLDDALEADHEKPLAIVSDVDDTVLSSDSYWERLISEGKQAFDDELWDEWVADNGPTATPGAVDFLSYAESQGVEVFYVSQRDQGDRTEELGLANLEAAGLPYVDEEHVRIQRESSDKTEAQEAVADDFEVVLYLGDNLNDFSRTTYVDGVGERKAAAEGLFDDLGRRFILFPNPTDGHWMKAIFGDSEPGDSAEYRDRFREAAEGELD